MARIAVPKILHPIAKILKSYGINGELIIRLNKISHTDINVKEPVFIYFDGLPVPFLISSIKKKGNNQAILQLKPITQRLAEEIIGEEIYTENFIENSDKDESLSSPKLLIGFSVISKENLIVGKISKFYDYPNNPCIEIITNDKNEVLIPFAEELIFDFNPSDREIGIDIPEGLINLQ